jgi:hypothetical protein
VFPSKKISKHEKLLRLILYINIIIRSNSCSCSSSSGSNNGSRTIEVIFAAVVSVLFRIIRHNCIIMIIINNIFASILLRICIFLYIYCYLILTLKLTLVAVETER